MTSQVCVLAWPWNTMNCPASLHVIVQPRHSSLPEHFASSASMNTNPSLPIEHTFPVPKSCRLEPVAFRTESIATWNFSNGQQAPDDLKKNSIHFCSFWDHLLQITVQLNLESLQDAFSCTCCSNSNLIGGRRDSPGGCPGRCHPKDELPPVGDSPGNSHHPFSHSHSRDCTTAVAHLEHIEWIVD